MLSPARGANVLTQEAERIAKAYERRGLSEMRARYSLFLRPNLLRTQEVERRLLKVIGPRVNLDLRETKVLDVGCGSGNWLRQFIQWGASPSNVAGIDLLEDRIAQARRLCPPEVQLEVGEASHLDFADQSFDIVFQSTVFSSILDGEMRRAVAQEMLRVLAPSGFVLWYDFFLNNPRNPDVRGIGKHELDRLFPRCRIQCERLTLAPPIGRALGRVSAFAYNVVSALRFASTHILAVIEKDQ